MKTLKKIGFVLLAILLFLIILGLFISKDLNVKVERNLTAPKAFAFNLVNDLKTVPSWNSWVTNDPNINVEYGDITMGEGASYSWSSEESGDGNMVYNKTYSNDSIVATMNIGGWEDSKIKYTFSGTGNKSKMGIEMDAHFGFPFNLMKWLFKNMIRKGYNESLDNIENILAERQKGTYNGYDIKDEIRNEKKYLMNRDEVGLDNIQKFYTQNLGAIFQKIQNEGVVMDGSPSGLFFKYDVNKGVTDMAAGIPLMEAFEVEGLTSYEIPPGPALIIDYYGDYELTGPAHYAIEDYMRDRGLLNNPPVIEEYVTDPLEVKDPEKWLTKIIYYYSPKE